MSVSVNDKRWMANPVAGDPLSVWIDVEGDTEWHLAILSCKTAQAAVDAAVSIVNRHNAELEGS